VKGVTAITGGESPDLDDEDAEPDLLVTEDDSLSKSIS
jgi:hypothetical protein